MAALPDKDAIVDALSRDALRFVGAGSRHDADELVRVRELLHTTEEVVRNERETKTLALAELATLRARIAAAIEECCEYERVGTWPEVAAAKKIRAVLEGR